MKKSLVLVAAVAMLSVALLGLASSANAATLLFEDAFANMSHLTVGDLDSGRATFSIVASPDGKAGTSLKASFDGADGANWTHRLHDLGGVMPTSGVVTYTWRFMHNGVFDEGKMGFSSTPGSYYPQPFSLVEVRDGAENMGFSANDAWVLHPNSPDAFGPIEPDVWYTFAMVVDLDSTTDNVDLYLAEGLDIDTNRFWSTTSVDAATYPLRKWQFYKYAYGAEGAWDSYVDDLAIYEGMAVKEGLRIPGDANLDYKVNEDDAATIAANWLSTVEGDSTLKLWKQGDFNADFMVNDIDATMMAANWQYGVAPEAAVPEPGACVLLLAALATFAAFRLKRGKK